MLTTLVLDRVEACDDTVLAVIPPRASVTEEPSVDRAHTTFAGQALAGARVSIRSAHPVAAWEEVLEHPETQVTWLPERFGVLRMERFAHERVYEQLQLSFLFGAIKVQRQFVVEFGWRDSGRRFENCWQLGPEGRYAQQVAPWATDVPWQTVGMGAWRVDPIDAVATAVSYELWAEAGLAPAIEAWALSRTLPDLVQAFDARVGETVRR